jgi:hypothetical protein
LIWRIGLLHEDVGKRVTRQQPDGDDTPGVAAAPVALAGVIMPGIARFIVMLSAQAAVFGVGTTVVVGSMLVPPSSVTAGWIVPGAGLPGSSGVESGKAAPLVGGPPGVELHTVVDELPSGDTGDMVPVVLPTIDAEMAPNGVGGVIAVVAIAVADDAEAGCIIPLAPPVAGMEVICTAGVPGAICPVGTEQVTTVPGVVGSEASGTGESVVPGVPGSVVAENGLGPLSGDVTIVAGVDGRPMAVVPMTETCARQALQPSSRAAAVNNKDRISVPSPAPG